MLNKIISLSIRGGLTFVFGFMVAALLHDVLNTGDTVAFVSASIIWFIGGIYSLASFNNPYNFVSINKAENKVIEMIDNKNKQQIEDEMLRIKKLLDNGILTEDEYNLKIKSLKDKYL